MGAIACIVGPGAVGNAIAARLQVIGFRTIFWGREGVVSSNVQFEGWGKKLNLSPLEEKPSSASIVFVTVKAYQLKEALAGVLGETPHDIPVIALSNGAIESDLNEVVAKNPSRPWRIGMCNAGISSTARNSYALRSSNGFVSWGGLRMSEGDRQPTPMENEILSRDSGCFLRWADDALGDTRRKWLFNVVINSLCAAHDLESNGLLLQRVEELKDTYKEAYALGEQLWGPWPPANSREMLHKMLLELIRSTSSNENSMRRDCRLGRRTENQYLAGMAVSEEKFPILYALSSAIELKTRLSNTPKNPP